MNRTTLRGAFTLAELLVIIAVTGVVLSILLPAIEKARAAADRTICANNLRQIGIGLQHYVVDQGSLPPGGFYPRGAGKPSWSVHARLLPYLEQDKLGLLLDLARSYEVQPDVTPGQVPVFVCPSDPRAGVRQEKGLAYFPTNYLANMGIWRVFDPAAGLGGDGVFPANSSSPNRGLRVEAIQDGLSNTIAFSEGKTFAHTVRDSGNPSGSQAAPPSNPAAVIAYGGSLQEGAGHAKWVDGRVDQTGFTGVFPPNADVRFGEGEAAIRGVDFTSFREGQSGGKPTYAAVTARSFHPGFVNCLLMDGSVRPVTDRVSLRIWRAYLTRAGGEYAGELQ